MNLNNQKNEKSFYKRWWFIAIAIIVVVVIVGMIFGNGNKTNWSSIELGVYLPEPKKGNIDVGSNLDDYLSMSIKKVSSNYYQDYKKVCIEMGYTIESESNGDRYEAFNNDGYNISLYYSNKAIEIILEAPEKMSEFEWPQQGLAAMLPTTKSNVGVITEDSSKSFRIHVGNTTINEFNKYMSDCQNKGFNIDYTKQEKHYYSKNSSGYTLSLSYLGFNTIDILIQTQKEENTDNSNNQGNTTIEEKPSSNNSSKMRKDFKEAMDSYEKFIDEYITFMKKYLNSDGTDSSLISDYSNFLNKYAEAVKGFEKWKNNGLNNDEISYYAEVQLRVSQKLIEISN